MGSDVQPADKSNANDSGEPLRLNVLRMSAVVRRTGLCRSTIYRLVAAKKFPMPMKLSSRAIGWREADVDRWSASLPPVVH